MLILDRIRSISELGRARGAWESLYLADRHRQVFLSWPWLSAYLPTSRYAWTILALREEGNLIAALPLAASGFPTPRFAIDRELHMGANPSGDYTGMLCVPHREDDAIEAFARAIALPGWENFNLTDTRDPRMERLAHRIAELVRGEVALVAEHRCWSIPLPSTWEEYICERLDAKARKNTLRAMRRVAELPGFRFSEATASDADRHIEAVISLKHQRFGGKLRRWRARFQDFFRNAHAAGALRIFALWDGDRAISASAVFVDAVSGTFNAYMRGHDAAYDALGPGRALTGFLIRRAIEDGYRSFDFLRGDEAYKRDFTEEQSSTRNYLVTRPGPRAAFVNAARPGFFAIKLRIAKLILHGKR